MTAPHSASVPTEKSLTRQRTNRWTVEQVLLERLGEKHTCLVEWSPSAVNGLNEVGTVRLVFWTGPLDFPKSLVTLLNNEDFVS